ncbi:MAG TPA: hypothetical protein V6D30_11025 [Leptolyngbyaceae cyanobacterium]
MGKYLKGQAFWSIHLTSPGYYHHSAIAFGGTGDRRGVGGTETAN